MNNNNGSNNNSENKFFKTNELDFNREKREDYEQLMKESQTQLDGYWDSRNPFVKIMLLILLIVIAIGSVFIIFTYFDSV